MPTPTTAFNDLPHPNAALTPNAVGAGGVDWLAVWRTMYDAERAQSDAFQATMRQSEDHWAGQGTRFARAVGRASQPDAFMRFVLPHLDSDDTVLDVGAGSGRHTAFLAEQGMRVVAIEPSATMRRHLEQRIAGDLASRVTVIPERMPVADLPSCDVVICSHVIYGVREIGPFLNSIRACARRACFVVAGRQQPSYMLAPFWERFYGTTRLALPGALECLNVLYQLGIAAQATVIPTRPYTFADEGEALEDIRWRLGCAATPANDARLRTLIGELLERDANGQLRPRFPAPETLVLWWGDDQRKSLTS